MVVEDKVDFELRRDVAIDGVEELPKLQAMVPSVMPSDNLAIPHVERGEERRGAVANVVMRSPFEVAWLQRQNRLGATPALDLVYRPRRTRRAPAYLLQFVSERDRRTICRAVIPVGMKARHAAPRRWRRAAAILILAVWATGAWLYEVTDRREVNDLPLRVRSIVGDIASDLGYVDLTLAFAEEGGR